MKCNIKNGFKWSTIFFSILLFMYFSFGITIWVFIFNWFLIRVIIYIIVLGFIFGAFFEGQLF